MPFTKANGHSFAMAGAEASIVARKGRPPRKSTRSQVLELKDAAHKDALAVDTPVGVKASLMRAYVDLHEIDMAIRGIGKPKPIEARNSKPKTRARSNGPVGDAKPTAPAPSPEPPSTDKPAV